MFESLVDRHGAWGVRGLMGILRCHSVRESVERERKKGKCENLRCPLACTSKQLPARSRDGGACWPAKDRSMKKRKKEAALARGGERSRVYAHSAACGGKEEAGRSGRCQRALRYVAQLR